MPNLAQLSSIKLVFLTLSLCGLIPLYLACIAIPSSVNLLPFGLLLYAGFRLSFAGAQPLAPLNVTFWVFVYVFFGVTAYLQTSSLVWPWYEDQYTPAEILTVYILIVLGLIARDLGALTQATFMCRKQPHLPAKRSPRSPRVSLPILLGLAAVSLGVVPLLGGLDVVLGTRGDLEAATEDLDKSSTLVLNTLLHIPAFVALALLFALKWPRRGKKPWLTLFLLGAVNLIVNFPLSLPRFWLGAMGITVLLIFSRHMLKRSHVWVIGLLALLLVAFPYADFTRNRSSEGFNYNAASLTQTYTSKGDFDAYQMMLNMVRYTNLYGMMDGQNLVGAAFFFIPRSIWQDKPYGTGQTVAERLGYRFTNLSAPLWGEAFVAFGYLCVFVIFFLYGWVSRILDSAYRQGERSWLFLISCFMGGFTITLLRGDLMNAVAYSLPVVIIFGVFAWYARPRRVKGLQAYTGKGPLERVS